MSPDDSKIYVGVGVFGVGWQLVAVDPRDATVSFVVQASRPLPGCAMAMVPLRGDLNGDGRTDLTDFSLIQECLGGPNGNLLIPQCDAADLDVDGDVDLFDFRFFQWAFSGACSSGAVRNCGIPRPFEKE